MTGHVLVVGGGLAGLSAALDCVDAGARVTLLEGRPRLGGATWSARRGELEVDNGQHVFLRCCTAYRGFLARLGVEHLVALQPRLAVPVAAPGRGTAWIRSARLPCPAHLAPSLLRFHHLAFPDRLRAARTARRIGALDLADPALDRVRFGDWLRAAGEPQASVDRFWDLLVRPTLNLPAREASLALATKVIQTGFLERADGADVGWALAPLRAVHADPAERALRAAGASVLVRAPVDAIDAGAGRRPAVVSHGTRLEGDAVVLAVPHEEAAALLPPGAKADPEAWRGLGRGPIVNLHVVFDRPVLREPLLAAIDSPLQWIFDRTASSGLARGQYLAVSLSSAEAYLGLSQAALRSRFLPAFEALLPEARGARVLRFFVTAERVATFRQAPGTRARRPAPDVGLPRVFVAGAWTDTGWPATMEGAVRSGHAAARAALAALGAAPAALPAVAAA
ncbi:MAG: hydroxysqualene dehydroxylase HpnE [Deltaproteobacteria bacterium]|nr:hydroxysqualene dehydroxylase HpnE [Deltaproteobacteria bacterium]